MRDSIRNQRATQNREGIGKELLEAGSRLLAVRDPSGNVKTWKGRMQKSFMFLRIKLHPALAFGEPHNYTKLSKVKFTDVPMMLGSHKHLWYSTTVVATSYPLYEAPK